MPEPAPEQLAREKIDAMLAEVEHRLSVIEELEALVAANLQRATRLRQAILHRTFSGKPNRT